MSFGIFNLRLDAPVLVEDSILLNSPSVLGALDLLYRALPHAPVVARVCKHDLCALQYLHECGIIHTVNTHKVLLRYKR